MGEFIKELNNSFQLLKKNMYIQIRKFISGGGYEFKKSRK